MPPLTPLPQQDLNPLSTSSLTKLSTAEGQKCGHKNVMVKINVFEFRHFSILCNLPQADDALHC
jgi:hypothetical protein